MLTQHPIFRVESFRVVASHTLEVAFDDGTRQTIDFHPVLSGELYAPLRDPALFNLVKIDPEVRTLVWPNGVDFDPATLHDWPKYVEALTARAQMGISPRLITPTQSFPAACSLCQSRPD
jgi:hypothetical protein